jgi:uncharacterized protein (DUF433 family)
MSKIDRITTHPEVCLGHPTVRGIRITVDFIVKMVDAGHSMEEILSFYPMLDGEDIRQALEFTRIQKCEA